MARVSVIIPAYNHGRYVAEAVQSVLEQDFTDLELIVVDDGSTDDTVAVVKQFADPRLKLIEFAENQSACVAANRGIREASGEYLAMFSSDDIFLPGKLGRQVDFLDANPSVLAVFGRAEIVDETGCPLTDRQHYYYDVFQQENRRREEWLRQFFYHGNCLCHPSALIRRTCFDRIGLYDERLALVADLDYWIRICLAGDIHVMPENLIRFRVRDHELNASGRRPETQIRYAVEMRQVLKHFAAISDGELLAQIFPSVASPPLASMVPFAIAMLALQVDSPIYQCFAVDLLCEIMANRTLASTIQTAYQFGYRDLIGLTARYDIFNLVPDSLSKVYLDTGAGFSEQETLAVRTNPALTRFRIRVELDPNKLLKAIRWDPAEGRLIRVKIQEARYRDGSGAERLIAGSAVFSNGILDEDGYYTFDTLDPIFIFGIGGQIRELTVSGEWTVATPAELDQRLHASRDLHWRLKEARNTVKELTKAVATRQEYLSSLEALSYKVLEQETRIQQLESSFAWRMTALFRWLGKLSARKRTG